MNLKEVSDEFSRLTLVKNTRPTHHHSAVFMNVHSYGKYKMDHEKAPDMRDLKKRPLYLAQKSFVPDDIDLAQSVTRPYHQL